MTLFYEVTVVGSVANVLLSVIVPYPSLESQAGMFISQGLWVSACLWDRAQLSGSTGNPGLWREPPLGDCEPPLGDCEPSEVTGDDYDGQTLCSSFVIICLPSPSLFLCLDYLTNVTCLFLLEFWRWTLCMHEYIFGLWKGACGKTFSKNWTECLHVPEETHAWGEVHTLGELALTSSP